MKRFLLIFILISAAILRLTTLPKLMVFTPDEEYLLYIAQTLVKDFHIIWIGVSALGFDLYMGPFWIYIIYPFVALTNGNPLSIGIITSILGIFTTYLLYWLGKKIFNQNVGLIAAVLYAFSPLLIFYDQQPYPPGVPFLSLLLATTLYLTRTSNKWWIAFAAIYGMVFHIHLSLTLIILVAIYWAFFYRNLNKKILLLSILSFIIVVSPLIAFDYFHKGSNITTPIRILNSSKKFDTQLDLYSRFNSLLQPFSRIWYLESNKNNADEILNPCIVHPSSTTTKANLPLALLTLSIFLYFVSRKITWQNHGRKLLILLSSTFIIPFLLLPVIHPVEYYLLGFFPLLILIISATIESFKKYTFLIYLLILIYLIYSTFTVFNAVGDYGLNTKKILVTKIMSIIGNDTYDLSEEGLCHKYGGWRYIFSNYERRPERSSDDSTFAWLYPEEVTDKKTKYSVIIKETRDANEVRPNYKYSLLEGGFTGYIYEN